MPTITGTGPLSVVAIERADDDDGAVTLRLAFEDGTVVSADVGITLVGVEDLADTLDRAAKAARELAEGWQDRPDYDDDGWVALDDRTRQYRVSLSGDVRDSYPTRGIALFELACAMSEAGYFPNAWIEGEDWGPQPIDTEVRAFHDDGGDQPIELPGVEYEPGADVEASYQYQTAPFTWETSWEPATVIRDYGTDLGVLIAWHFQGEDHAAITDRTHIRPAPAEQED